MWQLNHFGQNYTCNGTISQAIANLGITVNGDPYINGERADLGNTPPEGATVTFRPRAAGKAN